MTTLVLQRDVAALGALLRLSAGSAATAGGAGDNTSVTGVTVDRAGINGGSLAGVLNVGVAFESVLASGATLSIGYSIQDSADGVAFADYQSAAPAIAATGPTGGGSVAGVFDIGTVNLSSARRYIRTIYKPDLSSANTDTASFRAIGFAAGFDRLPS